MGIYLNPGNDEFSDILNGQYVDKTGLIEFVNQTLYTADKLTCVSRPRRFGKSFAAKMLCAYYDRGCDSQALFEGLTISHSQTFEQYLNQLNVICLDIAWFISTTGSLGTILTDIQSSVIRELREAFPDTITVGEESLSRAMLEVSQKTGLRFFVIIDEWDALFREAKYDETLQRAYVTFLRGLFKGSSTAKTIAGAYMTGILPIKKYGTQSALTDFREYTMLQPGKLVDFIGFTGQEVQSLCEKYTLDYEQMGVWYDGYAFHQAQSVYSPSSVMSAIRNGTFGDYWAGTETYESLKQYICMNLDGLKDAVILMLGGTHIRVNTRRFQNDMTTFRSRDDVLTLLIHLGYLAYDAERGEVYIPNREIADEFQNAIEGDGWEEIEHALAESEDLLAATMRGDGDAVAKSLEGIHESTASVLQYNNEASLSCAIRIAYYTAQRKYTMIQELPSGKGYADIAFIPRRKADVPAMIVELKCDRSADAAIQQIKERRYQGALTEYTQNLLLVGINYDKDTKTHTCAIEKYERGTL